MLQPYAQLIVEGLKNVENRTKPTKHRGLLFIQASLPHLKGCTKDVLTDEQYQYITPLIDVARLVEGKRGYIIGCVDLVDCQVNSLSIWAMKERYHYILENARMLDSPVRAKGQLGLWKPPVDVIEEVLKQIN